MNQSETYAATFWKNRRRNDQLTPLNPITPFALPSSATLGLNGFAVSTDTQITTMRERFGKARAAIQGTHGHITSITRQGQTSLVARFEVRDNDTNRAFRSKVARAAMQMGLPVDMDNESDTHFLEVYFAGTNPEHAAFVIEAAGIEKNRKRTLSLKRLAAAQKRWSDPRQSGLLAH